jgi:ABC-type sugar transport system ATPase subunit
MESNPTPQYRLELVDVSKAFPGVQALSNVTLRLLPGEVHALVGENGAGKSTLMKILSGAYPRDAGRILLDGQEVQIHTPNDALKLGIVTIYQESNLALEMDVAENIFMGRAPRRSGVFVDWRSLERSTQALLDELDAGFGPRQLVKELSPAQRQMVEIAKALSIQAKVIVLDEPTAALTEREVDILFQVVRRLKEKGVSVIYISHRLVEIFQVADRVTVLRDGLWVATNLVKDINEDMLVMQMVGRQIENLYTTEQRPIGDVVLAVEDLSGKGFNRVSFEVRAGEIVGLFGLVGSGRTDVMRALFGAEPARSGKVTLQGRALSIHSPRDAIQAGLALAPEDRKSDGLVLGLPVRANISLPSLRRLARLLFIRSRAEKAMAREYIQSLDIRCPSPETQAQSLSGGNQQKVVIAKWLARHPQLLILDEPTRGIDVSGKAEVHRLMNQLAAQGVAILMVSSELPEILGMSDRVIVMREGRLVGELQRSEASEERVLAFAASQSNGGPPK